MVIDNLITDPHGYEVLWDYCLEQGICLPDDSVCGDQTASSSGSQLKDYSLARLYNLGISSSGIASRCNSRSNQHRAGSGLISRCAANRSRRC